MHGKFATAAAAVAATLLGLTACTSSGSGSDPSGSQTEPKDGGTLVIALPGDIDRTDPMLQANLNTKYVLTQVFEGLVGLKPGTTNDVVPVLATALPDVSADGTTYTFTLRQGVKFQDGTPFNAEAVKYNYDRWRNLPDGLQGLAFFGQKVFGGFGDQSLIKSVDALGDDKVAIHLTHPQSNFLLTQAEVSFAINSPTALKAGKADNSIGDVAKIPYAQGGEGAATGTGPYEFVSWTPGTEVVLKKNPNYWDSDHAGHVDKIVFRPIADPSATLNALQAGDVDFAQVIDPNDLNTVSSDPNLAPVKRGSSCNIGWLGLNSAFPLMQNKKIRQAIGYALNRQSYVDAFFAGQADVAKNWMPADTQFAKPLDIPTYDPDKAKSLLAESGVKNPTIDFWYPSGVSRPYMPDPKGLFEAISSDLTKVGFTIESHTAPWSPDYLDAGYGGKYEMHLLGSNCAWAGSDFYLKVAQFGYVGPGKPNPEFDYKNDALNDLMNQALSAPNDAAAGKLWSQAQDMVAADLPTIPLVTSRPPGAAQASVHGIVAAGNLNEHFNTVWLDR